MQKLAEKCRMQPWVIAAGVICIAFVLWGSMGELLCRVVGYLYPMYASFRALEDGEHEQVSNWLKYWVVFAAIMLTDSLFYWVLCWIPLYSFLRLLLIVWLFSPVTFGAKMTYRWLVEPVLCNYRSSIDLALDQSAEELHGTLTGERYDKLREAWHKVGVAVPGTGSGVPSERLGLQELVSQELAKEGAEGLRKVAAANAASKSGQSSAPSGAGQRRRVASPAPVVQHAGVAKPAPDLRENQ